MNASPVPPSRGPVADWRLGLETGRVEAQCRKPFRGKEVVHSPSRSLPDTVIRAFSSSLTTTVFSQRSIRRFDNSPRRAAPKGQTFIFCTAPRLITQLPSDLPRFVAHPSSTAVLSSSSARTTGRDDEDS